MANSRWKTDSAKFIAKNRQLNTQSFRVLMKFGGPSRFHELTTDIGEKIAKKSVYKWLYPKRKGGTGGLIPTNAWDLIFKVAKYTGVLISSADCDPRCEPVEPLARDGAHDLERDT